MTTDWKRVEKEREIPPWDYWMPSPYLRFVDSDGTWRLQQEWVAWTSEARKELRYEWRDIPYVEEET